MTFVHSGNNGYNDRFGAIVKLANTFPTEAIRADAKKMLQTLMIEMVNAEDQIEARNIRFAADRLRDFMVADSKTYQNKVESVTPGAITGTGTGGVLAGLIDHNGEAIERIYAEDILVKCTKDGQHGGTTGNEVFSVRGEYAVPNLSRDWPNGSGANTSVTCVNAAGGGAGNLVNNSAFENFTVANTPDNWTLGVGIAGTDFRSTTTSLRGTNAIDFNGDGSTLVAMNQVMGGAQNQLRLKPLTVYCTSVWVRVTASTPAAGVLRVSVRNASDNAEIGSSDLAIDLTTVSTTYVNKSIFWATPADIPTSTKIQVELTTAITAGKDVFIDELVITPAISTYLGGPYVAIVAGATDWVQDDQVPIVVANNAAADSFLYEYRRYLPEINDIQFATTGSPSEADTLISNG